MRHPDRFPPSPHDVSSARAAADLIRALTGRGVTGIYTTAAAKFAVISVTAELWLRRLILALPGTGGG